MGLGSGSALLSNIARELRGSSKIPPKARQAMYEVLVKEFADADCDTLDECEGIDRMLDDALRDQGWFGD